MKQVSDFPLVRIDWIDSTSSSTWTSESQVSKIDDIVCHSVGYLVGQTEWTLTISTSLNPTGDEVEWADPLDIPKVAIIGLSRIKEPKMTRIEPPNHGVWEQVPVPE